REAFANLLFERRSACGLLTGFVRRVERLGDRPDGQFVKVEAVALTRLERTKVQPLAGDRFELLLFRWHGACLLRFQWVRSIREALQLAEVVVDHAVGAAV